MTKKDYLLIANAIHRTNIVNTMDKNSVRRNAKLASLRLLINDLSGSLQADNPMFDGDKFYTVCGLY